MVNRSMTDVAYDYLVKKKKAMTFKKIWEEIVTTLSFNESVAENKLPTFYANISLDARFALVENGKWDLRTRRTFNEVHKDLSDILDESDDDIYNEDELLDEDDEEKAEKISDRLLEEEDF